MQSFSCLINRKTEFSLIASTGHPILPRRWLFYAKHRWRQANFHWSHPIRCADESAQTVDRLCRDGVTANGRLLLGDAGRIHRQKGLFSLRVRMPSPIIACAKHDCALPWTQKTGLSAPLKRLICGGAGNGVHTWTLVGHWIFEKLISVHLEMRWQRATDAVSCLSLRQYPPSAFILKQITSYGGRLDFTINYNQVDGARPISHAADVIIAGNGVTLDYLSNVQPEPGQDTRYVVVMKEVRPNLVMKLSNCSAGQVITCLLRTLILKQQVTFLIKVDAVGMVHLQLIAR